MLAYRCDGDIAEVPADNSFYLKGVGVRDGEDPVKGYEGSASRPSCGGSRPAKISCMTTSSNLE